ncbi:MAG: hypothetical protein IMX02_12585 [Limnochordaceae bacterium]|nr:hypothetical protein [Limnochordaceae bacterium]
MTLPVILGVGLVWAGPASWGAGGGVVFAATPRAQAGVLDLEGWRPARDELLWLDGEWALYWQRLLEPADFASSGPLPPDGYVPVPGPWTRLHLQGHPLPATGYATYRLQIRLDSKGWQEPHEPLALSIGYICSAYRLWVNGQEVASNGRVGVSPETEQPQYLPVLASFYPQGPTIDVVVQVSNFYHRCNGIWSRIALGPAGALQRRQAWSLGQAVFLLGAILIMALYHVALYLSRRNERVALYFGLFCLTIALRTTVTGEELWLRLAPQFPTGIELRLEYLTDYLALPLFFLLLNGLYPYEVPKSAVRLATGVAAAGMVSLAAPAYLASWVVPVYEGSLVPFVAYALAGMVRAVLRRRDGAYIFLAGAAALFAALINDLLNYNHLAFTAELLPLGLFALILSQSVLLAQRFSHAFTELQRSRRMLTEREEQLRRNIAEMLHGAVQTRLLVAVHQVSEAEAELAAQPERARELLSSARGLLEAVREREVREASHLLHPSIIRVGLVPAVRSLAQRFRDRFDVDVQVSERLAALDNVADNRIPESIRLAAYRVLEEAFNNIAVHAGAARAEVHLDVMPDGQLRLSIRDDGAGFDPATLQPGLGLRSIAARVVEMGGAWHIDSRPGLGTTLTVWIPLTGIAATRPSPGRTPRSWPRLPRWRVPGAH